MIRMVRNTSTVHPENDEVIILNQSKILIHHAKGYN
jgi:hypothetical protein